MQGYTYMKLKHHLAALCLMAMAGLLAFTTPASAQFGYNQFNPTRQSNIRHFAVQQATAGQTFATTAYADLANTSITFTPVRYPNTVDALGGTPPTDRLKVYWSADVQKATATTGVCAVYVNGAVVTASERAISSAALRGSIGGVLWVTNSVNAAQTVKLQCKSGDTNIFTVNYAQMVLEEVY